MKKLLIVLGLLWAASASAGVINVEYKFTPFTGDPAKDDHVKTVPGTAAVFLNNVLIAEQPVREDDAMVLFEAREISPAVWVPVASIGSRVRKGKNTIRIEFTPENAKAKYRAQLRWASVMDETTEERDGGHMTATNQAGEGVEDKNFTGKAVFEKEFQADFAADQPWHHYPPVTALTAEDKAALARLAVDRLELYKPDFRGIYKLLEERTDMDVAEIKKARCLDQAWAAGFRMIMAPADKLQFTTTGNPEVVIGAGGGDLYVPEDVSVIEKITDEDVQMCIGFALMGVYPPRLVVVRSPSGAWEVID